MARFYSADEYFGSGTGDYKWTTVTTIHNALLYLVAQKKGLPLCEGSCSAASSEVRNQLAAADLNLAAANVTNASLQAECDDLRRRLADADGSHIAQIAEIQTSKASEIEWFKPVFAGDTLKGTARITNITPRNAYNGIAEITIDVRNQNGELVLSDVTESVVMRKASRE